MVGLHDLRALFQARCRRDSPSCGTAGLGTLRGTRGPSRDAPPARLGPAPVARRCFPPISGALPARAPSPPSTPRPPRPCRPAGDGTSRESGGNLARATRPPLRPRPRPSRRPRPTAAGSECAGRWEGREGREGEQGKEEKGRKGRGGARPCAVSDVCPPSRRRLKEAPPAEWGARAAASPARPGPVGPAPAPSAPPGSRTRSGGRQRPPPAAFPGPPPRRASPGSAAPRRRRRRTRRCRTWARGRAAGRTPRCGSAPSPWVPGLGRAERPPQAPAPCGPRCAPGPRAGAAAGASGAGGAVSRPRAPPRAQRRGGSVRSRSSGKRGRTASGRRGTGPCDYRLSHQTNQLWKSTYGSGEGVSGDWFLCFQGKGLKEGAEGYAPSSTKLVSPGRCGGEYLFMPSAEFPLAEFVSPFRRRGSKSYDYKI